ncbi:hypothetical protein SLE2022_052470 [Rubroshorea leprosula]
MDPIEISSSDSDFDLEIENSGETDISSFRDSANSRVLPQWAVTDGTNSRSTGNGNMDLHQTINSRIANGSGREFERLSSQQALKRTLPPSIQLSRPSMKANNSVENVSSSQIRDIYGNSYHLAGPSFNNGKSYMRDHSIGRNNDEVMMYENNGSRILPPSLMHGRSVSSTQFSGSKDPVYRPGMSEERVAGNDERLIYQAAVEVLNQPKLEVNLPDGLLSVPLLRHQKIALSWMLQKENRGGPCLGGILADDQGLGKTVSMIALIQMQRSKESKSKSEEHCNHKTETLNLDEDDDDSNNNNNGGLYKEKLVGESSGVNHKTEILKLDDDGDDNNGGLDKEEQIGESEEVKPIPEVSSTRASSKRRLAAGTLVVCPASVLRQWARELDEKVAEEAKLSVLVYHGATRTKDPAELAKYDVVLTTYSIVTIEVPKRPLVDENEADEKTRERYGLSSEFSINKKRNKASNSGKRGKKGRKGYDDSSIDSDWGPLARVGWSRVILDEAQTIKNHRTQVARACCSLRAKRRWCLSGTPIQNAIDDLYSYFRFLRYGPYDTYKLFYEGIKLRISKDSVTGYRKLQAVLRAIMLRRTKATLIDGEPIIKLPPKSIHLSKVDFSTEERAFYMQLEADSRSQFKAYAAAGTVNQNYANILLMLLRLRQACDHPLLVKGYNSDSVAKDSVQMVKSLPKQTLINLLNYLETSPICRACNDPPEDPVVTICGHVFCYQCVSEYLTGDDNTCPAVECKEQLGQELVFSKATLRSSISDDLEGSLMDSQFSEKSVVLQNEYSSSKIRAVIEILQSQCKLRSPESNGTSSSPEKALSESCDSSVTVVKHTTVYSNTPAEGPIKAIIFSQWTGMLDLVELSLNQYCFQYRRLDGTMTLAARDRAVKDFNTDPEVTVMLMSLKAGNLGLNMVAACHVILLDLWWNPTTEDQAVDRAHRIGQTRPVTVTRLTIKDTVEDRILSLQEEKRKMVASAFGEDASGAATTRLTVEELRYLFLGPQNLPSDIRL